MKTERLEIKLSKEEKEWIEKESKKNFMNKSEFLRMLMFNHRVNGVNN